MTGKVVVSPRSPYLALPVLLVFAVLLPFVRFEANDDIQMLTAASGAATGGTGMPQLVFVSSVLGRLLVPLYAWTRSVEWYGILMGVLSMAAVLILSYVLLAATDGHGTLAKKLAIVGSIAMLTGTVLTIQFTRVGLMLAFAGTLLVLCDPVRGYRLPDVRCTVLGGALLMLLGFMCRFDAAMLGLLLGLPAALVVLRQRGDGRSALSRVVVTALLAGPLVLGHTWLDDRAYATPDWRHSLRYFQTVRPFADYHLHRKVCGIEECARRSEVWTVNDIRLLDDFTYADPVVFSESNVTAVSARFFPEGTSTTSRLAARLRPFTQARLFSGEDAASAAAHPAVSISPNPIPVPIADGTAIAGPDTSQSPAAILKRQLQGAFAYPEFALFCFMLTFALLLVRQYRRLPILVYVGWLGLLLAAIYLLKKPPPPWVIRPFWLASAAVLLVAMLRDMSEKPLLHARRLAIVVLAGLSIYVVVTSVEGMRLAVKYERSREEFLAERLPTDAVLVTSAHSFPIEALWRPFGGNASVHANRWLLLGWSNGTPLQTAQLRGTGISHPLVAAACGEHALFLGSEYHARLLETFARENGGAACEMSPITTTHVSSIWRGNRVN